MGDSGLNGAKSLSKVGIAVVSYRSGETLRKFLDGVAKWDDRGRMAIVDNAQEDGCRRVAQVFGGAETIYIGLPNPGYAAAVNAAARSMLGSHMEYLLVCNPDVELGPEAVLSMLECAEEEQAGLVFPALYDEFDRRRGHWTRIPSPEGYMRWALGLSIDPDSLSLTCHEITWSCGACFLVHLPAFEAVGLMDDDFFLFMEEADLGFRMRRAGIRVLLCPAATVKHYGGHVVGANQGSRVVQTHVAKLLFYHKHYGRRGVVTVASIMFVESICKVLLSRMSSSPGAKARRMGYAALLRLLPSVLRTEDLKGLQRWRDWD